MNGALSRFLRLSPLAAAALFTLCSVAARPLGAQSGSRRPLPAPVQVSTFHGQYCRSVGPRGWAVIAENPQRVGFGADLVSADGKAAASYSIFAVGRLNPMPGFETPDRAVAASVSHLGAQRVRMGQRQQLDRNIFLVPFETPSSEGIAFYQVIPEQYGSAMVVLRLAYAAAGTWRARGPEASAVARSLHCNVPSVPAAPDPPSLNHKPTVSGRANDPAEADSGYNVWLDKEYFHNSQSGENFWVSPSQDWNQNGPEGPGYYAQHGNSIVKLEPGYSQ